MRDDDRGWEYLDLQMHCIATRDRRQQHAALLVGSDPLLKHTGADYWFLWGLQPTPDREACKTMAVRRGAEDAKLLVKVRQRRTDLALDDELTPELEKYLGWVESNLLWAIEKTEAVRHAARGDVPE